MAKEISGPALKKPVSTTPPMAEYLPAYLTRRAAIEYQVHACKSGRTLGYFTEGDPADPAVVCFPGLGQSKGMYIFPEPLSGVYLIAVDRLGHGSSSDVEQREAISYGCADYLELVDSLGVGKFYCAGHSMGGTQSLVMAVTYPDRVLACAPVSAPADFFHPTVTKDSKKKMAGGLFGLMYVNRMNKPGFRGACIRKMTMAQSSMCYHPDKTKDYKGMMSMAMFYSYMKSSEYGGSKRTWAKMDKDLFFVTKTLDAELHGNTTKANLLHGFQTLLAPYDVDFAKVKCPTFLYHGKLDAISTFPQAERNHQLVAGSELIAFEDYGHVDICMGFGKIILALARGKSVKSIDDDN